MAVSRQKVEDDPLTMFMNNPDLVNEPRAEPEPCIAEKPVPKAAPAPASIPAPKKIAPASRHTEDAVPGFSQFTSSAAVASFPPATPTATAVVPAPEVEEDIFGRESETSVGDDMFKGVDINKKGKGSNLLRLGNEKVNEDELTDLSVNKLLEEEQDLDYAMFGTSDVAMNGYAKPSKLPAKNSLTNSVLDDIDLNNGLIDLDIKEPDTDALSAAMQYTAPIAAEPVPAATTGDFDINAYIKSQAEDSGGGLFD